MTEPSKQQPSSNPPAIWKTLLKNRDLILQQEELLDYYKCGVQDLDPDVMTIEKVESLKEILCQQCDHLSCIVTTLYKVLDFLIDQNHPAGMAEYRRQAAENDSKKE